MKKIVVLIGACLEMGADESKCMNCVRRLRSVDMQHTGIDARPHSKQTLDSVVQRMFHCHYPFKNESKSQATDAKTYCKKRSIGVKEFKINADEHIKETPPELPERIFPELPEIFTRSEKRPKSPLFAFGRLLTITPLLKKGR
jgi:hypothetical protein